MNKDDIVLQISGEDLTEAIQSAAETLRSAELNMDNLQEAMNNYTVTSPISGTIIEKNAKAGDALATGADLCTIYDLSYLVMVINVDELQVSDVSVGQSVQVTADAVPDKTYTGTVTRVSMKGTSSGGTTTYPVTVRIDETEGLRPGMNANAEIVTAEAGERSGGAQCSHRARRLCVGDQGFAQCRQCRPRYDRTGRLCVRSGQDWCERR